MHRLLALDLATTAGWAFGPVGARKPVFGSLRLGGEGSSQGVVFGAAMLWFDTLINEHKPTLIVFEAPLATNWKARKTSRKTASRLNGLPAILEAVSYIRAVQVRSADASAIRCHFIGRNLAREDAKRATITRCKQLGWQVSDDNAADACALWDYASALIAPEVGISNSPLFRRSA